MSTDNKKVSLQYKLHKIKKEQFATIGDSVDKDKEFGFSITIDFNKSLESEHIIIVSVRIEYSYKGEPKPVPFLVFESNIEFDIEKNDCEKLKNENGDIIIPKMLAHHFSAIVLGSARGMLHAYTENTPFNEYPIPLIDLTEVIKSDFQA